MTKTQIWVAAFLGLFLVLFSISYLTKEETPSNAGNPMMGGNGRDISQTGSEATPSTLITRNGCTGCHGPELQGTKMGPSLASVKENWSREELISYLRNPSSFMDKDRFKAYRAQYSSMMPPFNHLDIKDLGKIADLLLKQQ